MGVKLGDSTAARRRYSIYNEYFATNIIKLKLNGICTIMIYCT